MCLVLSSAMFAAPKRFPRVENPLFRGPDIPYKSSLRASAARRKKLGPLTGHHAVACRATRARSPPDHSPSAAPRASTVVCKISLARHLSYRALAVPNAAMGPHCVEIRANRLCSNTLRLFTLADTPDETDQALADAECSVSLQSGRFETTPSSGNPYTGGSRTCSDSH